MAKTKIAQSSEGQVVDQVVEIIRFMGENKLAEIDLETSQMKLKLKKHGNVHIQAIQAPINQSYMPAMPFFEHQSSSKTEHAGHTSTPKPVVADDKYHKVLSPMAGTFYRSPSPNSEPFCKEGDSIKAGQTVCIVEAMKMMNEIKSDKSGKVIKIMIENGKSVDKGSALFQIGD